MLLCTLGEICFCIALRNPKTIYGEKHKESSSFNMCWMFPGLINWGQPAGHRWENALIRQHLTKRQHRYNLQIGKIGFGSAQQQHNRKKMKRKWFQIRVQLKQRISVFLIRNQELTLRPVDEIEPNSKALNCSDALTCWILGDFQGYFLAIVALQCSWCLEVMKPLCSFSSYS